MPRKSYKPEEIVAKLRQVDVLTSQGESVAKAIRSGAPLPTAPLCIRQRCLPLTAGD
jgi:hypothetical protein